MSADHRFALGRAKVFTLSFTPGELPTVTVRCTTKECTTTATTRCRAELAPPLVVKRFRHQGWDIDNEATEATCPDHVKARRKDKDTVPKQNNASPDARKAQFAAGRLLEEHYDAERSRYQPGWTDARIATETGASPAFVAETREAVYGPIVDEEVEVLQTMLAEACALQRREVNALRECIVKVDEDFTTKVDEIRKRIAQLHTQRRAVA